MELGSSNNIVESNNHSIELENTVKNLKAMLDKSRAREKRLVKSLEELGCSVSLSDQDLNQDDAAILHGTAAFFDNSTFQQNLVNRASWLIGLLIFQSLSSYILSYNEKLLQHHPNIIFFLTMLVGAGGNAGNQATVRVIREIAVGSLHGDATKQFVIREFFMAISLSFILGLFGLIRVCLFSSALFSESLAISASLSIIVFLSIVIGAVLPLSFQMIGLDPANSSTTIQVIMDISGVLITCLVATVLLDTELGLFIISLLRAGFA
jgi:Mg/Co/Ni transporter MgtE